MKLGAAITVCALLSAAIMGIAKGAASVDDPYLWLEDIHGERPLQWVAQQNARALKVLKSDPDYQKDYDELLAILDAEDRIPAGTLFRSDVRNFWQDAGHPKGIWRRTSIASYETAKPDWDVLLDVDKLAADEHENWVFSGVTNPPSFRYALVSLSRGGGDAHVVREFDPVTKTFLTDGFVLPEAKSDAVYANDDTILFDTDFGPGSMTTSGYPRIVKLWKRGEKIADAKTLFEARADDVGVSPFTAIDTDGTSYAFLSRAIDFFHTEYSFVALDGTVTTLPLPVSAVFQGVHDGYILATFRAAWTYQPTQGGPITVPQGALAAISLKEWLAKHDLPRADILYVPDERATIEAVSTGESAVYVDVFENVIGSVYAFHYDVASGAWSKTRLGLPEGGSASIATVNDFGPQAQFGFQGFLDPPSLYADDGDGDLKKIKSLPPRFDASGLNVMQYEATSSDGTKIPYFLVRKASAKGPQATILYGYGGFEVSQTPWYWATAGKVWLSKGGAIAVANIRGGGEFGPAWHDAALKEHRQRAFDDFAAVAADLEKRGVTTPQKLGIMGGSNGGLLVSTVMIQHPELLGAVVCQVPLIDMIRYTQIGAGASWIGEYGDPADPKARAWLLAYSPYQNVRADKAYPPVFFVTATSDDRVTPVHARKMAAKMEAQGHDVLFFENTEGGHAAAANHKQQAEMWALSFVYLKRKLGLQP